MNRRVYSSGGSKLPSIYCTAPCIALKRSTLRNSSTFRSVLLFSFSPAIALYFFSPVVPLLRHTKPALHPPHLVLFCTSLTVERHSILLTYLFGSSDETVPARLPPKARVNSPQPQQSSENYFGFSCSALNCHK